MLKGVVLNPKVRIKNEQISIYSMRIRIN